MKHFVFTITIAFFISCQTKEKSNDSNDKIIFLTSPYSKWVERSKSLSYSENIKYGERILDSLFYTYFSKCEYSYMYKSFSADTSVTYLDFKSLQKTIELIDAKQQVIQERINKALSKCRDYIDYNDLNIFIFPGFDSASSERSGGVGGFTVGSKHITIAIDPFVKGWEDQLEITIAHEFHHAYWTKLNFRSMLSDFLDRLIFEGKAEVFSHLVYPEIKQPWDSTLSHTQKKELWNMIRNKLTSNDFIWQDSIMFGIQNYPYCGGYILGRDIVEATLKKTPSIEPKHWTNFSPDYFLKENGYK